MSELFKKMIEAAVERKLQEQAEIAADRIVKEMTGDGAMTVPVQATLQHLPPIHPKYPTGRTILFPAHTIVGPHADADVMIKRHHGRERELLEACLMLLKEKGPQRRNYLSKMVQNFAGPGVSDGSASAAISRGIRVGTLIVIPEKLDLL